MNERTLETTNKSRACPIFIYIKFLWRVFIFNKFVFNRLLVVIVKIASRPGDGADSANGTM